MKKIIVFLLSSFLLANIFAQSELPEKYPDVSKVKVKDDFPSEGRTGKSGKGFSANLALLPNGIKKVALVSFFVFDPGLTKTWTTTSVSEGYYVTTTTTTTYTKKNSTGAISGDIAYGAFAKAIDPMIAEFKALGMELLLPHQYLDTEEKKQFYNSFEVKHEKSFANWVGSLGAGNHDVMYGTMDGFKVEDIVKEPYANYEKNGMLAVRKDNIPDQQIYVYDKDTDMSESLGYDLCTKLGVDAVLVTYMTVFMPKDKKIDLVNARFVLFGPNPVMPAESKGGPIPHVKGLFYYGASANPESLIYNENKKVPGSDKLDFTGFDTMYIALVRSFGEYYKEKTEKK
jgi:hypothetical protein